MDPTSFPKSPTQQMALVGHTFANPWIWDRLDPIKADENWLTDAATREVWKYIQKFRAKFDRPPSLPEFKDYLASVEKDARSARAIAKTTDECLGHSATISTDYVLSNLALFWKSYQMVSHVDQVRDNWNTDQYAKAEAAFIEGARVLQTAETIVGHAPDKLQCSADRADKERLDREANRHKYVQFGVTYLDDVTGGIAPNSLVLVGAPPGAGKTQLATAIASHNADLGKRVSVFALEAEEFEWERRLKYQLIAAKYRTERPNEATGLNYADWYSGKFHVPEEYEKPCLRMYRRRYKTMNTFYRKWNNFGAKDLDREIYALKGQSDLIIIDHLHYMDFNESENENRAVGDLVKHLRNLALVTGIPIILVVHLKKKQGGGEQRIISNLDDIHGTSNIAKMATTAVLIGRAVGMAPHTVWGYPTFMRLAKHRIDAAGRTSAVGLTFYNSTVGLYYEKYIVGHMNWAETKWAPYEDKPAWATDGDNTMHVDYSD